MFREEMRSVLLPEDRVRRILDRLIAAGLLILSGLSLTAAALVAARGEELLAGSLCGLALVFTWQIDQASQVSRPSFSRRLSRRALKDKDTTPNTRLEQTR